MPPWKAASSAISTSPRRMRSPETRGGEGLAEPVGDERNGFASGADAGASDGLRRDAGACGEFGEGLVEIGGGGGCVGAHALDGAGADACELAGFVGEKVVGFGAADIEG